MLENRIHQKTKKFAENVKEFSTALSEMKDTVISESSKIEGEFQKTSVFLEDIKNLCCNMNKCSTELEDMVIEYNKKLGMNSDVKKVFNLTSKINTVKEELEKIKLKEYEFSEFGRKYQDIESYISAFYFNIKQFCDSFFKLLDDLDNDVELIKDLEKVNLKVLKIQEEERKKLSLEIHDGPAQSLANIVMQLEYVKKLYKKKPDEAEEEMNYLIGIAKENLKSLRNYIFDLRPMTLDDFGIVYTVKRLIENINKLHKTKFNVDFRLTGDEDRRFRKEIEISVFRIIQESVNNAIKHGKMTKIEILLKYSENSMIGEIIDDGEGFEVNKVLHNYSEKMKYGISSLMERAELVGGDLNIISEPLKGTCIRFKIPI